MNSRLGSIALSSILVAASITCVGCSAGSTPEGEARLISLPTPSSDVAEASGSATLEADRPRREKDLSAPPDVDTPPADVLRTSSGLASRVLVPGTGVDHPGPRSYVRVHYIGWTRSGRMFDTTVTSGTPATFSLEQVIPGWSEGVALMVEGEERRFWIPSDLAYGDRPKQGAPAGPLTFDVELVEILRPPPTPDDVDHPPASSQLTTNGVAMKFLQHGTGTTQPTSTDSVVVHYSGWTQDGKLFDSSVERGMPAEFKLSGVIKGFGEAIGAMVVGDKVRVWIPAALAYGAQPRKGAPTGQLTFEIELIEIK